MSRRERTLRRKEAMVERKKANLGKRRDTVRQRYRRVKVVPTIALGSIPEVLVGRLVTSACSSHKDGKLIWDECTLLVTKVELTSVEDCVMPKVHTVNGDTGRPCTPIVISPGMVDVLLSGRTVDVEVNSFRYACWSLV